MTASGFELFGTLDFFADLILNLEYGLNTVEKQKVCSKITQKLMNKIMFDLAWWIKPGTATSENFKAENTNWYNVDRRKAEGDIKSAWRHVRTRLYFASLSHLNSILFLFVYGIQHGYLPS